MLETTENLRKQAHEYVKAAFVLYRLRLKLAGRKKIEGIFHYQSKPHRVEVDPPDVVEFDRDIGEMVCRWYPVRGEPGWFGEVVFFHTGHIAWGDTFIISGFCEPETPLKKETKPTGEDMSYNGHKNWDFWNVALWLFNDEGLYRMVQEEVRRAKRGGGNPGVILGAAARGLMEVLPSETPDGAEYTLERVRAALDEDLLED